ncbi:MAG: hypothetical protein R6V19_07780 [Armatimonadota bacterium]
MATRYVLFWFDVEDCTVPQSDDAAMRLAEILTAHGIAGTMKVVGQKARMLRQRLRYKVIDALDKHAIGFHSDMHGGRPQPAEYMGPCDWLEGIAEFERRERRGVEELIDLWGRNPVCYGQPGSNWSPQVFPVLRKWDIRTYVSGFGYVHLRRQPFRYGGIVNTSHMYAPGDAEEVRNHFTLGFDLGEPEALAHYRELFDRAYDGLSDGGLISIANHPCQLVLKRWFSTDMKSPDMREAGYRDFEEFVQYILSHDDVEVITADRLPELYPDRAMNRVFSVDEMLDIAAELEEQITFVERGTMAMSAAEIFGMLTRCAARILREGSAGPGATCMHLDGPAGACDDQETVSRVSRATFEQAIFAAEEFIVAEGRMPDRISIEGLILSPVDYLGALARSIPALVEGEGLPEQVIIDPVRPAFEEHVDIDAARAAWTGAMMPENFSAPKLLQQALLQAWTLKPAILAD